MLSYNTFVLHLQDILIKVGVNKQNLNGDLDDGPVQLHYYYINKWLLNRKRL